MRILREESVLFVSLCLLDQTDQKKCVSRSKFEKISKEEDGRKVASSPSLALGMLQRGGCTEKSFSSSGYPYQASSCDARSNSCAAEPSEVVANLTRKVQH